MLSLLSGIIECWVTTEQDNAGKTSIERRTEEMDSAQLAMWNAISKL